jgi:protein XRP2
MAERPDPADFRFSGLSEQELVKLPGQIRGYDFILDNLTRCNIYLLDHSAQITIDDCTE